MDDGDDDFGDLYADVEVEANSAMNNIPKFSQLQLQSDKRNGHLEVSSSEDRGTDGVDDDEDEDDFNIVLNSDDDNNGLADEDDEKLGREEFVEGKALGKNGSGGEGIDPSSIGGRKGVYNYHLQQHSQYKYVRSQSAAYASTLKGNGCGSAALYSSSSPTGDQEDNGYRRRVGSSSMGPQYGQNFSLPRSRTILDVNIDIFEQKPWKQPGADVTDYFNFGLNEDSWKVYCNQVDEYRHRASMSSMTPASEPVQLTERKGGYIQVEDSIVERKSSMDVVRQLNRDSDVIQITLQDPGEACSGSIKGVGHTDSSAPEASDHGNVSGDYGADFLCFSSGSEDESLEEDHQGMEIHALKRSPNQRSNSIRGTRGSENHESNQISDVDGHHYSTVICGSDGTDGAVEASDNTNERVGEDTCTTDLSILRAKSSEEEKTPASHYKSFEDGAYMYKQKFYNQERHPSTKSSYHHSKHSKRLDEKRKPGDPKCHASHNNLVLNNRRLQGNYKPKDSFPMSYMDEAYDAHLTDGRYRLNERLHAFDSHNRKHILYSKESELHSDYYGERFSDYENSVRDLSRNGYERFGFKKDPFVWRSSEEEEYYHERRRSMKDDSDWYHNEREISVENMDSFTRQEFEGQSTVYPTRLKYKGSGPWERRGNNMHFRNKENHDDYFLDHKYVDDIRRGKYKSYDGKKRNHFERRYVEHVEYTRRFDDPSVELLDSDGDWNLTYREDHSFASRSFKETLINSSRWRGPMMSRNNLSGRQGRYRGQWVERFRENGSLDNYSDPFGREENASNINDHVHIRRRRDWQPEMQWYKDETMPRHRDARFQTEGASFPRKRAARGKDTLDADHVEDLIDDPHLERRKFKLRREGNTCGGFVRTSNFSWGGSREQPYSGDSLDSPLVDGSDRCKELIDDPHAEERRYKQTKEVNNGNEFNWTFNGAHEGSHEQTREVTSDNKFNKTSNVIHKESHEQPLLSCRDPLDLNVVVREGKPSEEYYKTRSKTSMAFNSEAIETNKIDEQLPKKFKICEQIEGSDIEEGQILTEEINVGPTKVKELQNRNGKNTSFDNPQKILEVMAKMEKRRERFKKPIDIKKDPDNANKVTVVDSVEKSTSIEQQRPARKRRWGGS